MKRQTSRCLSSGEILNVNREYSLDYQNQPFLLKQEFGNYSECSTWGYNRQNHVLCLFPVRGYRQLVADCACVPVNYALLSKAFHTKLKLSITELLLQDLLYPGLLP